MSHVLLRLIIIYSSYQHCALGVIVDQGCVLDCGVMVVESSLELNKMLGQAIGFFDEEGPFASTVELDTEVVTNIGHGKNIGNTMGVVPNLIRVARELAHLIGIGPSGIALDAHVMIGLLHILEERAVGENINLRACVKDNPGGREVTIILGKLVGIISNKIFHALH